ncbi:hypothetical protein KAH27_06645 [bacterium]|nr:hypothetical protein [bacterium]
MKNLIYLYIFSILFILFVCFPALADIKPLKISANGKHLIDSDMYGEHPFEIINGKLDYQFYVPKMQEEGNDWVLILSNKEL